jgi:hypothetical protein
MCILDCSEQVIMSNTLGQISMKTIKIETIYAAHKYLPVKLQP